MQLLRLTDEPVELIVRQIRKYGDAKQFRFFDHLDLAQVLMDELHRNRSLANSGRYPLYGTVTNIAHGKKAGNICLKQKGIAIERPPFGALPVADEIGASQQETALVSLHQISQ